MNKKYNYTYITTNIINGKQYVGDHSTNNLKDNYLGSGTGIKNAIKKYGKKSFERKILEQFDTKQEAFDAQEKYINEYNTLSPNGYNNDKRGGYCLTGINSKEKSEKISKIHKGKKISEEHKQKIREFMKTFRHSEETKQKLRKPKKSKKNYANIQKGKNNNMYGISLYDLWIKKYGKVEADLRRKNWQEKRIISYKRNKRLNK